ncbi:MAG: membrane protein insertion efficiency factor YidD [Lentisphaeria bacterium]|nr:membrane protein insertion efficiency factor YidD [Lentisphaerota bacterium]MBR7145404.1 membrane protein insertion efficiency factor YidD [Lentisphaeria bacterium]
MALPLLLIRVYQLTLSPFIGQCCRFTPSCSRYATEALKRHGFWYGSILTIYRLIRCQPFCKGGYDPVPPRKIKKNSSKAHADRAQH